MRINRMRIKGLFGLFDYSIPFHTKERITIIHAPNGYGKTTILKIIDCIYNGKISELERVPFKTVIFDYTNKSRFEISKNKHRGTEIIKLSLKLPGKKKRIEHSYSPKGEYPPMALEYIEEYTPQFIIRVESNRWIDTRDDTLLTTSGVVDQYLPSHIRNEVTHMRRTVKSITIPDEILHHFQAITTRFIKSERLFHHESSRAERYSRRKEKDTTAAVVNYSEDLRRRIERKLAESASYSQNLDRTFPSRLIQKMATIDTEKAPSRKSIENKLIELEETRFRLQNVGLFAGEVLPIETKGDLDKHTLEVLSMYIEDNDKKLEIFKDMERKINLFLEILNSRYTNKIVTISSVEGFKIILSDGNTLNLQNLSSGEQHELVLNYELLFYSREGSLILIDEPEISLHISWQLKFLNDLQKIANLTNVDILIATHSPQIIHDKWDLTIDLGEGNGN